jgi:hypothetical protein
MIISTKNKRDANQTIDSVGILRNTRHDLCYAPMTGRRAR